MCSSPSPQLYSPEETLELKCSVTLALGRSSKPASAYGAAWVWAAHFKGGVQSSGVSRPCKLQAMAHHPGAISCEPMHFVMGPPGLSIPLETKFLYKAASQT